VTCGANSGQLQPNKSFHGTAPGSASLCPPQPVNSVVVLLARHFAVIHNEQCDNEIVEANNHPHNYVLCSACLYYRSNSIP